MNYFLTIKFHNYLKLAQQAQIDDAQSKLNEIGI